MKKYILAKDLPDHPAGTPLSERIDMAAFETAGPIKTIFFKDSLQRAIETGWVKEVEERVTLRPGIVFSEDEDTGPWYVVKKDEIVFTPEEINLMEKALNGELMERVDLQKFVKWWHDKVHRSNCIVPEDHAELLEAFNNREK